MSANNNAKPPRPCTEYNLFFQLERAHILQVLLHADPALEPHEIFHPSQPSYAGLPPLPPRYASLILPYDWFVAGKEQRRQRKHRKSHGLIGFHELSERIVAAWKQLDDAEIRTYCAEVHEVDARRYRKEMAEWKRRRIEEEVRAELSANAAVSRTVAGMPGGEAKLSVEGVGGFAKASSASGANVYADAMQALYQQQSQLEDLRRKIEGDSQLDTTQFSAAWPASDAALLVARQQSQLEDLRRKIEGDSQRDTTQFSAAWPASDAALLNARATQSTNQLTAAWQATATELANDGLPASWFGKAGVPDTNPLAGVPTSSALAPSYVPSMDTVALSTAHYGHAILNAHTVNETKAGLPVTSLLARTDTAPSTGVSSEVDMDDDEIMSIWKTHCGPDSTAIGSLSRGSSSTVAATQPHSYNGSDSASEYMQRRPAFGTRGYADTSRGIQETKTEMEWPRRELEGVVELERRTEAARSA